MIDISMGQVGCQIQSYWSSSPDVKSPWKLSINSYFAGLKVRQIPPLYIHNKNINTQTKNKQLPVRDHNTKKTHLSIHHNKYV